MNTETLKIVCSPFVPEESIDEFASNFLSIIDVSRERLPIERNRTLENFEVKELIDFTVHFISNNEFLQSVFKQVGIEAIKEVFKKTFSSVSKNKRDGGCSMEICLCYKDLKATFKVNGKYTKQDIQKCFNAFSDLIVSGQLFSDSKNPQFQKNIIEFNGVKYHYDINLNLWVPHDYEKDRQQLFKMMPDLKH